MASTAPAPKNAKVKFHEIPTGGLELDFSQKSGELDLALKDLLGESPVYRALLSLRPVDEMIHLKGALSAELTYTCSRCGENFNQPFSKNFITAFYKSKDTLKNLSSGIDELEGSFDLEFLEGNEINLAEVVHEQVAIEMPFQPLCSEDCAGLCTTCGTNLNTSSCNCGKQVEIKEKVSPFATLKNLIGE